MENKIENAQLIEVAYENDNKKVIMTFLDSDEGEVREVNFNKQNYDNDAKKWVDDPDKAQKVADWSQKYFGTDFDHISDNIDNIYTIYAYPTFNSMYPVEVIEKFTKDEVGDFFTTPIKEIKDDGNAIRIRFDYNEQTHESKMTYGKYVESLKKWFPNPVAKAKKYDDFKDKFGVPVEKSDTLIGKDITVEIKEAFGKYAYAEIKKMK